MSFIGNIQILNFHDDNKNKKKKKKKNICLLDPQITLSQIEIWSKFTRHCLCGHFILCVLPVRTVVNCSTELDINIRGISLSPHTHTPCQMHRHTMPHTHTHTHTHTQDVCINTPWQIDPGMGRDGYKLRKPPPYPLHTIHKAIMCSFQASSSSASFDDISWAICSQFCPKLASKHVQNKFVVLTKSRHFSRQNVSPETQMRHGYLWICVG